ncbi:hypothetical protein [Streptomyces sp. NPDC056669]|uniref:hypothetical protein n=1 Tax=Streptomyces sp. NPDC056669 TaxID=3345903 RepID=UPI00369EA82E
MTTPLPYHPPGDPGPDPLTSDQYGPVQQPLSGAVELAADRGPVVYVPSPNGGMVPVLKDLLPTTPAPAPVPVRGGMDPQAQRIWATGISGGAFAAGTGWGLGQFFGALTGIGGGSLLWIVGLLLAAKTVTGRGHGGDTFITHNHTTNRWWGRSSTSIRNH